MNIGDALTIVAITYDKLMSIIIYSQTFDYMQLKTRAYTSGRNSRDC